ncbi:MAG: flavodoxin-dependent (E)-4-hydroxy-3-methylbut-2-enyl-diphosphate synthase [Candidatus Wildermuthbacteria bacterium]|nr:flavodoxin-dependent (E)-4-hydroxy-3-methylbut-2-enyl-diphosphate synthase [Candidatus Wildermuthbacteria bacterium]
MIKRKKTKIIKIGNLKIGGGFPILIQSMTDTKTSDIEKTIRQIKQLEAAGCEIIRVGVPDLESAKALGKIKKGIRIPLVADIHFSADLALEAINQGADKIRINPGNFPKERLEQIVKAAKKNKIPIRVGINSGSLEKDILGNKERVTSEMMVESAMRNIKLMENLGFYDLVISLKAPDVLRTAKAYETLSRLTNHPLHLGITEAGTDFPGTVKSAIGIGYLLLKGIGDTIRVSLSAPPIEEIRVGWEILKSLDLRERGIKVVSCPTCARTEIDVMKISKAIESLSSRVKNPLKISVMGCIVNGLGEARESDFGVVGVKKCALLMKKGRIIKRVKKDKVLEELRKEIENIDKAA